VRLEAEMPNERWQADITHWCLASGPDDENLNVIDDHSRLLVASDARAAFKAADVVAAFHEAAAGPGLPASLLTDNGAVFTVERVEHEQQHSEIERRLRSDDPQ
jgi:transposase InsO family protein